MAVEKKGGKKGRKIGRNLNKPSHVRYNSEQRWLKNKRKRAKRCARDHARHGIKLQLRSAAPDYARITELRAVIAQNLA